MDFKRKERKKQTQKKSNFAALKTEMGHFSFDWVNLKAMFMVFHLFGPWEINIHNGKVCQRFSFLNIYIILFFFFFVNVHFEFCSADQQKDGKMFDYAMNLRSQRNYDGAPTNFMEWVGRKHFDDIFCDWSW